MEESTTPYRQGNHICAVYDTPHEQLAVAAEYVTEGLQRNERCLYTADSREALDRFRRALGDRGIDVAASETSGSLLLLT